jgi:hypothetical protein
MGYFASFSNQTKDIHLSLTGHRFQQFTFGYQHSWMIGEELFNISALVFCVAALLLHAVLAVEALQLTVEGALCENLFSEMTRLHVMIHDSLVRVNLTF